MLNPPQIDGDGTGHEGPRLSAFVLLFIDDILIFSKTAEEHTKHLQIVFELLRQKQLQIKPPKCVWGQTELPYLSFIVGIKPDPTEVETVTIWPTPTIVKEKQQLTGLTTFFRRFTLCYAKLAAPLIELMKKAEGMAVVCCMQANFWETEACTGCNAGGASYT